MEAPSNAVAKTIRVTNYATSFGAKNVQKTKFEAAEMILDPWNHQIQALSMFKSCNAMRVVTGGVNGAVDGQYIQFIHVR